MCLVRSAPDLRPKSFQQRDLISRSLLWNGDNDTISYYSQKLMKISSCWKLNRRTASEQTSRGTQESNANAKVPTGWDYHSSTRNKQFLVFSICMMGLFRRTLGNKILCNPIPFRILLATLSFTDPPGFKNSHFATAAIQK
jgi:hypothetical protein